MVLDAAAGKPGLSLAGETERFSPRRRDRASDERIILLVRVRSPGPHPVKNGAPPQ